MTKELLCLLSDLEGLNLERNLYLEDTFELSTLEGLTGLDVLKGLEGHYCITDVRLLAFLQWWNCQPL